MLGRIILPILFREYAKRCDGYSNVTKFHSFGRSAVNIDMLLVTCLTHGDGVGGRRSKTSRRENGPNAWYSRVSS